MIEQNRRGGRDCSTTRSRGSIVAERCFFYATTLGAFAFLVAMMCLYSLDFPYLDQWEFVALLGKSFGGGVTLHDLWAQHNEHRLIFPKAVMLVLAHMSGWDIRWELATNVILGAGLFAVLACQILATARKNRLGGTHVVLALVALMVFSLNQWENWFLGWQLQEFMSVLAVVSGLSILSRRSHGRGGFFGAIALGVIATYSFANGMAYWAIGAMVIALSPGRRLKELPIWGVVSSMVIASYLYDYHSPAYHPSIWFLISHPIEYVEYVLKYLGAGIVNFSETGALLAGSVCAVCLIKATYRMLSSESPSESPLLPYVGIGMYGMASAVITGMGRAGFGGTQALSPRYVTFSNLVLVLCMVDVWLRIHMVTGEAFLVRRRVITAGVLLLMCLLGLGSLYGAYRWTERYHFRMEARSALMAGDNLDLLGRVYARPEKVLEMRPMLREKHLSIFR